MPASPSVRIHPSTSRVSISSGDIIKQSEPSKKLDLLAKILIEFKKEYTKVFDGLFPGNREISMGLRNKSRQTAAASLEGATIKRCVALADGNLAFETVSGQVILLYGGPAGIGAGRLDSIEEAEDRAKFVCATQKFMKGPPPDVSKLELADVLASEVARIKLGVSPPEAF
jgi:hypothetical protein